MRLACMQHIFHDKPFFLPWPAKLAFPCFHPSSSLSLVTLCVSLSLLHLPPLICTYIESRPKLHSAVPMTMFIHKLLQPCQRVPSIFRRPPADPAVSDDRAPPGDHLAALKIIHAGGMVESYYMALLAATFIDRYPSFMLARLEVFRLPWDSVVRLEEILIPWEKYYAVHRRTVEKLRRHTGRRPA